MALPTVLHLTDSLQIGGAQRVLLDLTLALERQGIHSFVCSINNGLVADELRRNKIEVFITPKKQSGDVKFLWNLYKIIRENHIQVIHSHFLISHIYGWLVAKLARIPHIMTIHGNVFVLKHGSSIFPFMARKANQVITVSEHLKKMLLAFSLVSNIQVIYNGIDTTAVQSQLIDKGENKKRIGLHPSNFVIGSVGTLREVKGYNFLIEATEKVYRIFPKTKLVLVGDGPLRSHLEIKAKKLGIQNSVFFLGYRKDVPRFLSAFDVYICSSLMEGVSIALLEAMAASKPVVATNVGGNPEVVKENITGILVPPENSQVLAEAVVSLLNDEDKRSKMGNAGFQRVKEVFSLNKTVRAYEKIYLDVFCKH